MFLMSLANDFARFASIAAFLCLVVAHLECPDIVPQPSDVSILANRRSYNRSKPPFVHAGVADDLGVKGNANEVSLANAHH